MKQSVIANTLRAPLLTHVAVPAVAAVAAHDTLKVSAEGEPVVVNAHHVNVIDGPDSFAPEQITRPLIFAIEDPRAAIDACEPARYEMTSIGDGVSVERDWDTPPARSWVQLCQAQESGVGNASKLPRSADTPEGVAGMPTINPPVVDKRITPVLDSFKRSTTTFAEQSKLPPSRIALKHATVLLLALLASPAATAESASPADARFSGSANLLAAPQHSSDLRYAIDAELAASTGQRTERFTVTARLLPDRQTNLGVCATPVDSIFVNGFDS